jgi:hypothetical protein
VKVGELYAAQYKKRGSEGLHYELGAVADADQVVGHTDEPHHYCSAHHEAYGAYVVVYIRHNGAFLRQHAAAEDEEESEKYCREKRYAAETRYLRLVYLARVGRVEQLFAERDQQNLRYYDACDGYHAEKHGQVDEQPVGHGLWIFESFRKS